MEIFKVEKKNDKYILYVYNKAIFESENLNDIAIEMATTCIL